jgi:sulfur-carrier protein
MVIRVELPTHLKTLARVPGEVELTLDSPATLGAALTALEERFPVLRGAIRDHGTLKRRAFVRYYACERDLSLEDPETALPEPVARGTEPLMIVGAMAGG